MGLYCVSIFNMSITVNPSLMVIIKKNMLIIMYLGCIVGLQFNVPVAIIISVRVADTHKQPSEAR